MTAREHEGIPAETRQGRLRSSFSPVKASKNPAKSFSKKPQLGSGLRSGATDGVEDVSNEERRTARRYDFDVANQHPVRSRKTRQPARGEDERYFNAGIVFRDRQDVDAGSKLDITLTLPAEITHGTDVFVRAQGKVVRVERRVEDGEPRME